MAGFAVGTGAGSTEAFIRYTEGNLVTGAKQCRLLRDIFDNVFDHFTLDRSWLTTNVVALTDAIYDDYALDRLPDLADFLEQAGCHDVKIISYCRQPGPDVRGCWVVDIVVGK